MNETGSLMHTLIEDPENPGKFQTLKQFNHLSIQEFLAMLGLVSEKVKHLKASVKQLSISEQFNMALLFLYGLAFDDGIRSTLSSVVGRDMCGQETDARTVLMKSVRVSMVVRHTTVF